MLREETLMNQSDPEIAALSADFIAAWHDYQLPPQSLERVGSELSRLIAAYRRLSPPHFDMQMHHFAPLLEALADE